MNLAIVGSEERKFTASTKRAAIEAITTVIQAQETTPVIVSGRCPENGVDIWAEEIADALKIPKLIFAPEVHTWDGRGQIGYKQRNIQIATAADIVCAIVVSSLPPGYPPEPWNRKPCYHCMRRPPYMANANGYTSRHIKSGACWTAWYAIEKLNKKGVWIVL